MRAKWKRRLRLLLFGLLAAVVIFYVGALALQIDQWTRRADAPVCCKTPSDLGLEYENVRFTSADGVTLSGWYVPSRNRAAVIVLHGYGSNRAGMIEHVDILARHGYGVLAYDLRGHGESGGDFRALGWPDVADVRAAIDFVQARADVDDDRVGVSGFSIGGQIGLRAAVRMDTLKAVFADGPGFANARDLPDPLNLPEQFYAFNDKLVIQGVAWSTGVEIPETALVDEIDQIAPRPILIVAAGVEDGLERRVSQRYYDRAGEPKTLWLIPETQHGGALSTRPQEYEDRMIAFFDQALLGN
jgi:alpha-beta hydrolase superfamily lysophospholipase